MLVLISLLILESSNFFEESVSPIRLRVAELRKAKDWTQDELARRADVSRVTVNRIEREGNRRIDYDVLEKIADALGVNAAVLIDHQRTKR